MGRRRLSNICIVCGVSNKENSETLFKLPTSPLRREKWLHILNIDPGTIILRSRVCEKHFEKENVFPNRLKKGTVPVNKPSQKSFPPEQSRIARKLSLIYPKQTTRFDVSPRILQPINLVMVSADCNKGSQSTVSSRVNHSKCRRTLLEYKRRLHKAKQRFKELVSIDEIFSSNPVFLDIVKAQIRRYKKPNAVYSTFERTAALSLYYSCGKSGYRTLLSMGLKLPSVPTILGWISDFQINCGINSCVIDGIQKFANNLLENEKDCVIVWDEMSIKQWIEYNKYIDKFEGIVDLGTELGRSLDAANEALVFMVHGISGKWKFPVSYYFSSHSTKSCHLSVLVEENITCLRKTGLRIRMGICDMSFTNQGLYRSWGISPHLPFRNFEGERVYFIHDTPHLIKLIRNNLLKHNFEVLVTKEGESVVKKVRWSHVVSFFSKDRRLTTRMAPRLTKLHLDLKDFAKMKVRLAVQLLSASVYAGMKAMIELGLLKPEAEATATFIKTVDEMFDFLNMSRYSDDKYGRCAKYFYDDFHKLDFFISFVRSVSVPDFGRRPDFLLGLDLTLCGIKQLATELKNEGHESVYTRWLQQDCLENFFSLMRMKGGFCRNPTARQFRSNFRFLYFSTLMANPIKGNVECSQPKFAKYLENFQCANLFKGKTKRISSTNGAPLPSEIMNNTSGLEPSKFYGIKAIRKLKLGKEQEKCAIAYFGGACVHSVLSRHNCMTCNELLTAKTDDKHASQHLIDLKEFDPFSKRLVYLRSDAFDFFMYINTKFDRFALESLKGTGIGILKGIYEKYSLDQVVQKWITCVELNECRNHRSEMLVYFIKVKIHRLVKDKNEGFKKTKSWDQSRRELRNQ